MTFRKLFKKEIYLYPCNFKKFFSNFNFLIDLRQNHCPKTAKYKKINIDLINYFFLILWV